MIFKQLKLFSLNGELDQEKPNSEIKHVHHHHFVQDWDSGIHPGGTQTLPNRKSGQFNYDSFILNLGQLIDIKK